MDRDIVSTLVKAWRLICGVALGGWFVGCARAPAHPPVTPKASSPEASHLPNDGSQRVRSRTLDFPIELQLPSKAGWQVADGPQWLELRHASTASLVELRTWRAERLVRRQDCEAQARLERPSIPVVHDEAVIDRRRFPAPVGFETELVVGVEPTAQGLSGYAIAIGASVGGCYAAIFTTQVSGAGADVEVAERLGIAVDRILSSVRTRRVDERAVRHRLIETPSR